jgi:hypothetical protein
MVTRTVAALLFLLTLTQNLFPILGSLPSILVDAEADTTACKMACCRGKEKNPNCCCKKSHVPTTPSLLFPAEIPVGLLQESAAKLAQNDSLEADSSDHCALMAAEKQQSSGCHE